MVGEQVGELSRQGFSVYYSFGCPEVRFVDLAGLEHRDLPAAASLMQGSKACATMLCSFFLLMCKMQLHSMSLDFSY